MKLNGRRQKPKTLGPTPVFQWTLLCAGRFQVSGEAAALSLHGPPWSDSDTAPFAVFVNNKPDIFMVVERCRVNLAAPLSGRSWN